MNRHLQRVLLPFAVAVCYMGFVCFSVVFADPPPGYKICRGCVTINGVTAEFEITCPQTHSCCGYTNAEGVIDVYCRPPNIGPGHEYFSRPCVQIRVCSPADPPG